MYRKDPEIDIIKDILNGILEVQPDSTFVQSLLYQYLERGSLSKKQLEGLYNKASKLNAISLGKLATLEAEILKRPNKYKSTLPPSRPLYSKDENAGQMMEAILKKYPLHKRVLFLKSKYDNNESLSAAEVAELEKFTKLLM
jgi:hypothetical protein